MNLEYVQNWADNDPDIETRNQLQKLIDAKDFESIESLFSSRLSFGTAGLRAELGPGPMRMNRLVVSQTAQGIANFLNENKQQYLDPNGKLSAVIGFDARKNSAIFAKDSAEILQASGVQVELFDRSVPTPVVAFTSRARKSSVAIVVTASHNPPNDNGYKVYLGGANGNSQIIPPQDSQISEAIDLVQEINPTNRSNKYSIIGDSEIRSYLDRCAELAGEYQRSDMRIVYTAMHGVGWSLIKQMLNGAGFENIFPVESQINPDPLFPTVDFPNPEEPGAMDQAFERANEVSAELIIANDPDADRLAVGIPTDTGYRMLSGNELGVLLADYIASKNKKGTLAASYVSSRQIVKLAELQGFESELTPTGFKWISKVKDLIFGYEEALGYCVDPEKTPDKDGITAALFACLIARELKQQGITIEQKLDEISKQTGFFQTSQISIRLDSVAEVEKLMSSIRSSPELEVAGQKVLAVDLSRDNPLLDMLEINLDSHSKALIRASGTEPKLKCYLESAAENKHQAVSNLEKLERQMTVFLQQ